MFSSLKQRHSLLILCLGIGLGALVTFVAVKIPKPSTAPVVPAKEATPKVLYWYDPMEPAQHFDKPGKSPFMDMELVPKYADADTPTNSLQVDPAQTQNLGMRRAKVARIPLQSQLEATGRLRVNERDLAIVQLRVAGFVDKVWPLAVGDNIKAGQPIADFSIPDWLAPQNELLATLATGNPNLVKTLRARLALLGMPESLIDLVQQTRQPQTHLRVSAPINGVIELLDVKTGTAWQSGQTLVRIQGLDTVWLDAALPESLASQVHPGDKATFFATGIAPVTGTLDSILPGINEATRTLTARIVLPNKDGTLKPGGSGRVLLGSSTQATGIAIPTEAVIRTGKRTLVMVAEAGGHFRPVEIVPGAELGDQTLVISGLSEGQDVVASGQFLLDSEASLQGIRPDAMEMQP